MPRLPRSGPRDARMGVRSSNAVGGIARRRTGMIETERLVHVRVRPLVPPDSVDEVVLGRPATLQQRLHVFVETRREADMTWECSECGEHVTRVRPPNVCQYCGTAGIFVRADETEPAREPSNLHAAWLRIGMERGCLQVM
jgi:DNA-directed RNA polymerase subunit RPC12/RpoP